MSLTISHTTKTYPKFDYEKIKNDVLGKDYSLSLVFVGETKGRSINFQNRGKKYSPNVLSFPLTKAVGEIYITPIVAKREASKYGHSFKKHIVFLFIHGLLHLKGLDHGTKMETLEEKYLRKYS